MPFLFLVNLITCASLVSYTTTESNYLHFPTMTTSQIRYLESTLASSRASERELENKLANKEEQLTVVVEELREMQARISELISQIELQRLVRYVAYYTCIDRS